MIKFDHISLPVSNPEASRDWYVANLGFRVEFEVPERRTYALVDDADFTIFVYSATGALGEERPAFTLQVDDVEAKHAELSSRGVTFVSSTGEAVLGLWRGAGRPGRLPAHAVGRGIDAGEGCFLELRRRSPL